MPEFKPHIRVRNLSVSYDDQQALKDVTVEIPEKQITVIIGPSGCGKTTLLKSFNRLIDLADGVRVTGEVFVDGANIYDAKADVTAIRKKVGMLCQKPYPLPMSIYDNVAYGPKIHGTKKRKELDALVERYLGVVGLWDEVKDRLTSPASKLSIGQQQRLCLARSLSVGPEIILGDEPTSALDPISLKRIEAEFVQLKKDYTIVLVTHILRQARRLADHVVFMYLGEVVEQGSAHDFFENPKEERTKAYIRGEIS
jgi:phosphate transport system ATP-binding protein